MLEELSFYRDASRKSRKRGRPAGLKPVKSSAQRSKEYRARKAAIVSPLLEPRESVLSAAVIQIVVEQFQKLNSELQSELAEVESDRPALELGQRVLSDPDLRYLVEKMWFKSETQRDRIRGQIQSYRRSLKSAG